MADVAPADLEKGQAQGQNGGEEPFNQWYYIVYAFSMVVCVVGLLCFIIPSGGALGWITGMGLFVTGMFLPVNADLIVTYFRLTKEVGRFKENNKRFKGGLKKQQAEIKKLKKAENAFAELDKKFGGNIDKAKEELEELEASSFDKIQQGASSLLSMYHAGSDRKIPAGEEVDKALGMLDNLYCRIFPDYFARTAEMKKAMESSDRFVKEGGLEFDRMSNVFKTALKSTKLEAVPEDVRQVMIAKGRNTLEKEQMAELGLA